jgi:predicted glycosyltransferase
MTHLANAINLLISGKSAGNISKAAGIDPARLSRLRRGKTDFITQEDLSGLALAIGKNTSERAELIAAHLKDQSCGYYPDIIQISYGNKPLKMRTEIDPEIEYLQKHLSDSRIRNAVRSIVELHRQRGNRDGNVK